MKVVSSMMIPGKELSDELSYLRGPHTTLLVISSPFPEVCKARLSELLRMWLRVTCCLHSGTFRVSFSFEILIFSSEWSIRILLGSLIAVAFPGKKEFLKNLRSHFSFQATETQLVCM